MGRGRRRDQNDPAQPENLLDFQGSAEMAEMDGVEGAPQQSDAIR
jgi:hypothetical protein